MDTTKHLIEYILYLESDVVKSLNEVLQFLLSHCFKDAVSQFQRVMLIEAK